MNFLRKVATSSKTIPAFFSIDVEPDGFQLSRRDPPKWVGYESILELTEWLRSELLKRTNVAPKFGWYFRTDPQIAQVYGRANYVLTEFPARLAYLREKGDYFGVHSHPVRWCSERQVWIHDFADGRWNAECTEFALEVFARWSGSPAQRFRNGAGFLTDEIVEVVDRHGVKVEMSLEPVEAWPASFSEVPTGIDVSPYTGVHSACLRAPRMAYRPSRSDFQVAEATTARDLIIVPMTTYVSNRPTRGWRNLIGSMVPKSTNGEVRVLHLSETWPSAKFYWDLVSTELSVMRRPYLSVAVRTDSPGSPPIAHAQQLLSYLLEHPLSERLEFVDPIDAAPKLM